MRRTSLALQGGALAEARGARRASAYMHGHLAGLPPARHAGSVLMAGDASATPALQVRAARCAGLAQLIVVAAIYLFIAACVAPAWSKLVARWSQNQASWQVHHSTAEHQPSPMRRGTDRGS